MLITMKKLLVIRSYKTLEEKALENIVGKGENVDNQHFVLFQ